MSRRALLSVAAITVVTSLGRPAVADATFVLNVVDPPGSGFNDPTPATPIGGNIGTTLGDQRRISFQFAADIWGKLLDSPVPIVIEASFTSLDCASSVVVLGQAAPSGFISDLPGLPPGELLAEALADRILETDIDPGLPDIIAQFNPEIKTCLGYDWYYGLDAKPPRNESDLVYVVLHELTHGLGFITTSDPETGQPLQFGMSDPFSDHMLDDSTNQHWPEMTDSGRMQSAGNVRNLAWDGKAVSVAAPKILAKGAPTLTVSPAPPGFGGAVSEPNFGLLGSLPPVTAGLAAASLDSQCTTLTGAVSGKIALVTNAIDCNPLDYAYTVQVAGGVGLLLASDVPDYPPPSWSVPNDDLALLILPIRIPTLGVSSADAALLLAGTGLSATLAGDGSRLDGADAAGHVYLYAANPLEGASTGSHWDPLARPDLVMEPVASLNPSHDVTMELALLRDIGWASFCGNGRADPKEECDLGAANSDTIPNTCRTTCTNPKCGDAVVDDGEACDLGPANSDTQADACRTTCTKPKCGDGVADTGEECDRGPTNSDVVVDGCRTTCTKAKCGDGVMDTGEECDRGPTNSDVVVDGCRTTCTKAKCGDGVMDTGEECDLGSTNSDVAADGCRTNCTKARCGDGVMDTGEECDKGSANSHTQPNACRTDCTKAKCGDGVVDTGEECDHSTANSDSGTCRPDCTSPPVLIAPSGSAGAAASRSSADVASAGSGDTSGCGCRVGARAPAGDAVACLFAAATLLLRHRRWTRHARKPLRSAD